MTLRRALLALLLALPLVAATAAGCSTPSGDTQAQAATDDGPSARERVASGEAILVDVRTPQEFASGHVQGARNIPVQELASRMGELPRDKEIVVYCHSGARASNAAAQLSAAGYRVENIGAMPHWN